MKLLCCAIMVKNEEERIIRTLSTVIKHVGYVVVLDTGSTDNTIKIIRDYCKDQNVPLKLEEVPFKDFSYNRNILLKMCYGLSDFVILLDANDEIKHAKVLVKYLKTIKNKRNIATLNCRYHWENDNEMRGNDHTYYKIGVIRNNLPDIHYELPVHEFITSHKKDRWVNDNSLEKTKFHFYQDRMKDKSSIPRIEQDVDILKTYLEENGKSRRILRYICQSYDVLKDYDNLYDYGLDLIELDEGTQYNEDIYRGYIWTARAASQLLMDEFVEYYEKAHEYIQRSHSSAEPYYEVAKCYFSMGMAEKAYNYIKQSCDIPEPKQGIKEAAVNYELYKKLRWILYYNIAQQLGKSEDLAKAKEQLDKEGLTMVNTGSMPSDDMTSGSKSVSIDDLPAHVQETIRKTMQKNGMTLGQPKKVPTQDELKAKTVGAKLYLIVSYRDREEQLRVFIPWMQLFLEKAIGVDYEIIVAEQTDDSLFNKGLLYNLAVKHIKDPQNAYICFHDVDIKPVKGTNYYRPDTNIINHLYGYVHCLGGVFLVNYADYLKVNGFPNMFEGWGFEDNEYKRRSEKNGIKIDRSFFYKRYDTHCFEELDSDKTAPIKKMKLPQTKKNQKLYELNLDPANDGLAQLQNYSDHVSVIPTADFTLIKCNVADILAANNIVIPTTIPNLN